MDVKIKTVFLHAKQQVSKPQVSGKTCSQYMRMQEKANDRLQFRTIPIGKRDPQEDVVLSRVAIKQDVQGRRENREEADPLMAAAFSQGLRERSGDLEAPPGSPIGIDGAPRPVRRKLDERGGAAQLLHPVGEVLGKRP